MADNFVAEANNSAGDIFATDQDATSSAHYPIGKLAWGALNTFNLTSTSAPWPVQLFGNGLSSAAPVFAGNNSAHPLFVRGMTSSAVDVTGTVTVGNDSGDRLFIGSDSDDQLFVGNNSAHPVFVRGMTSSAVDVTGTVAVTNAGLTALSSAFTSSDELLVTGAVSLSTASKVQIEPVTSSANQTFVGNNSAHPVFVRGMTNSAVDVTGTVTVGAVTAGAGMGLNALSSATGALRSMTLTLSSLAQTVMTAVGRLHGYSVSNPDSAANVWFHIYDEDSAGVTLGTNSAIINQMVPFGGGREASWPAGILMSSGMSLTASATAPSNVHDAPGTSITINVYYAPST